MSIVMGPKSGLVKVRVCVADDPPIAVLANDSDGADTVGGELPAVPVAVIGTLNTPAEVFKVSVPETVPTAVGVKKVP